MSTTTTQQHTPMQTAPWKPLFQSHLEKIGGSSAEFTLATVTVDGLPRVRTCIHRSFWGTIPNNPHNKLDKNPPIYESDCPVFTTDARMRKVHDVFATGRGKGDLEQSRSGTGGGGPVEAVYWVKDTGTQWRIRGKCWFVAADDVEGKGQQNSGTVTVKSQVGRYMRPTKGNENATKGDWSWRKEVDNQFETLSPMMRGSFKNPAPSRPITEPVKDPGERLGQKAGHLEDEDLARRNFRVAIITPEEVEQVDLSNPAEAKRWVWTLCKESGGPGEVKSVNADGEANSTKTGGLKYNLAQLGCPQILSTIHKSATAPKRTGPMALEAAMSVLAPPEANAVAEAAVSVADIDIVPELNAVDEPLWGPPMSIETLTLSCASADGSAEVDTSVPLVLVEGIVSATSTKVMFTH